MRHLKAILGMLIFCNEGEGALANTLLARDLPLDSDEALSYLQTSEGSDCVHCVVDIATKYQEEEVISGQLTICQHLICSGCLPA